MDTSVQIALVGVGGPLTMLVVGALLQQWQKREEYRRQDAVAAAAKAASDALLYGQKEAARLLVSNTEKVDTLGQETRDNLGVIQHQLNSEKTEARREALDTCKAQLALMKEVIDLKRSAGQEPTVEAQAAVLALEKKIFAMAENLNQREKNDALAAEAAAKAKAKTEAAKAKDDMDSMLDQTVEAVSRSE